MNNPNLEKRREYRRAWNANNPDKVKEYAKKYYEKAKSDPDFVAHRSAYHAEWQKKNAAKWNAYLREHRRKKKAGETNGKAN